MNRRVFLGTVSAILASQVSSSFAKTPGNPEAAASTFPEADSYAIWSILIPILRPVAKGYLVPLSTKVPELVTEVRSDLPLTPLERAKLGMQVAEMQVPMEFQDRFREAAEDFQSKRQQAVQLQHKLTLSHPYRLLDAESMEEYRRLTPPTCVVDPSHPWHRDRGLEKKYATFSPPCMFSRVYFDSNRSLGLVWTEGWTMYAFHKEGSAWQRLNWPASAMTINC